MPTLDELNATDLMNDPNAAPPGGAQERFLMGLLAHASQQKGYQALQLPALALLLRGQLQGFDQQRAKQQQEAQLFKALQMQQLLAQTKIQQQKAQQEQAQQQNLGLLQQMITGGVPGQPPAPLQAGQEGPSPAPGFQVPNVPASPSQLYGAGLGAGPLGLNAVKDLLAAQQDNFQYIPPGPGTPAYAIPKNNPAKGAIPIPGTEKAVPQRPLQQRQYDLGDKVRVETFNPDTGQVVNTKDLPKTATPTAEPNSLQARAARELNTRRKGGAPGSGDNSLSGLSDEEVSILAGIQPKPKAESDKPPPAPSKSVIELLNNTYDSVYEKTKGPPSVKKAVALQAARNEAKRRGADAVLVEGWFGDKVQAVAPQSSAPANGGWSIRPK